VTTGVPKFPGGSVLAVGTFDGIHLGHQAIVREVLARAARIAAAPVLVTFEPHPASVLEAGSAPPRLTLDVERREFLAELGLGYLLVLRFDQARAELSAERFVREVLLQGCSMRELVIGPDHAIGKDREGDSRSLPALGSRLGFEVAIVPPVRDGHGEAISSTRIRSALGVGDFGRVGRWLGRPYRLTARVIAGAGRGSRIGIPTINLEGPHPDKALPPDGVYAARVEWGGGTAGAMLNQGTRPTVGDTRRSIEAHLFGVNAELHGRMVRVEWVERLRDIRRFASLDALREQLATDREQARAILAREPETSTTRRIEAR